MEIIQQKNMVIASAAAVAFLTFSILLLRRRNKKSITTVDGTISTNKATITGETKKKVRVEEMQPPNNWVQVGKVSGLHIYPMKSGRVVNLTRAEATEIGLQEICRKGRLPLRDRVFIIYREDDKTTVSNKTYSKLMKLTVNALSDNSVEFSLDMDKIIVKLPEGTEFKNIIMRKETINTADCGDEVAKWVSKLILDKNIGLRVGYWPGISRRDLSEAFVDYMRVYETMCNDFSGAYSDIGSYLIVNQSSVDDLNSKIEDNKDRVTAHNFRPNIVVEGATPYSEDQWRWIKIGEEAIFRTFKPCTRYRQVKEEDQKIVEGSSPMMGMYMGLHTKGRIKYGDPVFIGSV